jgi:hypothetical protein
MQTKTRTIALVLLIAIATIGSTGIGTSKLPKHEVYVTAINRVRHYLFILSKNISNILYHVDDWS